MPEYYKFDLLFSVKLEYLICALLVNDTSGIPTVLDTKEKAEGREYCKKKKPKILFLFLNLTYTHAITRTNGGHLLPISTHI